MVTLIPDFAQAMTESNRRAATSVDEEVQRIKRLRARVETLRELKTDWETLRRRITREAQAATRDLNAEAQEVLDLWSSAVQTLRGSSPPEEQMLLIQAIADLVSSGRDFRDAVQRLHAQLESMGGKAEGTEQLAAAGQLFDRVHAEAARALEVRRTPWQPADAARFEQGRQEVREGKGVSPDEARARFRKTVK